MEGVQKQSEVLVFRFYSLSSPLHKRAPVSLGKLHEAISMQTIMKLENGRELN